MRAGRPVWACSGFTARPASPPFASRSTKATRTPTIFILVCRYGMPAYWLCPLGRCQRPTGGANGSERGLQGQTAQFKLKPRNFWLWRRNGWLRMRSAPVPSAIALPPRPMLEPIASGAPDQYDDASSRSGVTPSQRVQGSCLTRQATPPQQSATLCYRTRTYYHSRTYHAVKPAEMDVDSEDELDLDWLRVSTSRVRPESLTRRCDDDGGWLTREGGGPCASARCPPGGACSSSTSSRT